MHFAKKLRMGCSIITVFRYETEKLSLSYWLCDSRKRIGRNFVLVHRLSVMPQNLSQTAKRSEREAENSIP
jgi:hypothetical protein